MTKIEIVKGQTKVNWLINGEYNFAMTTDAFAALVKQVHEFSHGEDCYMISHCDVEDDAEDDMESLCDLGGEA